MIAFLQSIINMILKFGRYIANLLLQVFKDLWEIVVDLFVFLFGMFLDLIGYIIAAIPVPDFISNGMQSVIDAIDPSILFFLGNTGLAYSLSVLGAGYTFSLIRRIATLGKI